MILYKKDNTVSIRERRKWFEEHMCKIVKKIIMLKNRRAAIHNRPKHNYITRLSLELHSITERSRNNNNNGNIINRVFLWLCG